MELVYEGEHEKMEEETKWALRNVADKTAAEARL
jgi:hypothetical protein